MLLLLLIFHNVHKTIHIILMSQENNVYKIVVENMLILMITLIYVIIHVHIILIILLNIVLIIVQIIIILFQIQ